MPASKHPHGQCPYCGAAVFSLGAERRPGQRVQQCAACGKYSILGERTWARYPLDDPSDPGSPPRR